MCLTIKKNQIQELIEICFGNSKPMSHEVGDYTLQCSDTYKLNKTFDIGIYCTVNRVWISWTNSLNYLGDKEPIVTRYRAWKFRFVYLYIL